MGLNYLEIISLFIFGLSFTIVFTVFLIGAFILLFARDFEKAKKGKIIFIKSLYGFSTIILIAIVFFSVTWLLKKGEVLKPPPASGEFPASPVSINFPPPPEFIKISEFYFNGPFLLKDNNIIDKPAIYSILCKKDNNYDIIYMGDIEKAIQLSRHAEYQCWSDSCQDANNLYVAIFWTPFKKYNSNIRNQARQALEQITNPSCPLPEE